MKRIILGSLLSCIFIGQVFGAAEQERSVLSLRQLCMNNLLEQQCNSLSGRRPACFPVLMPRQSLENDLSIVRRRVQEAEDALREVLPEPHELADNREGQEQLIEGAAHLLIEPFQAAVRQHEEDRQYIYDVINNDTAKAVLGFGLGIATPLVVGLLASVGSQKRYSFLAPAITFGVGCSGTSLLLRGDDLDNPFWNQFCFGAFAAAGTCAFVSNVLTAMK